MLAALTRPTGPELASCELTHIPRLPIDIARAVDQHAAYVATLRQLGVTVTELARLPEHPDAVFVEDTALVLDEVAVMLRPGAPSRLGELVTVAAALEKHRELVWIEPPATIDGGDLVVLGGTILVGVTSRTGHAGATALGAAIAPFGYTVTTVPVTGCLHLKTAITAIDDETVIAHTPFVDLEGSSCRVLDVPTDEPHGANVVRVAEVLLVDATAPRTGELLAGRGYGIVPVDVSEFAKAEGALSCKSVLFEIGDLA